jgi:hypothetical protein
MSKSTARLPLQIHLRLRELAQLFNSMDPSPFIDRDLDSDAEEFIVGWAREHPKGHELELVIQLSTPPDATREADVEGAVQHYFATRAEIKRRELRLLLRRGHASLAIGLLFLTACLLLSGFAARLVPESAAGIVREGFVIVGWVAKWRPLETYLYDWWPLRAEWHNRQRLARMRVRVQLPSAASTAPLSPS